MPDLRQSYCNPGFKKSYSFRKLELFFRDLCPIMLFRDAAIDITSVRRLQIANYALTIIPRCLTAKLDDPENDPKMTPHSVKYLRRKDGPARSVHGPATVWQGSVTIRDAPVMVWVNWDSSVTSRPRSGTVRPSPPSTIRTSRCLDCGMFARGIAFRAYQSYPSCYKLYRLDSDHVRVQNS